MEIKGYKAFNDNMTNRYGESFMVGNTYEVKPPIKFGVKGHGYHMCKNLEDVFRYFDSEHALVAEVTGFGEMYEEEDDFYGYYEMYACEKITINRIMTREEIINKALASKNEDLTIHFISTFKLHTNELRLFFDTFMQSPLVLKSLAYYQLHDMDVYEKSKTPVEIKEEYSQWIKSL